MKTTFCTLLILGLILPMALRAQDAPSRPLKDPGLEIEPTPLPKSSPSPAAKPTPRATPPKTNLSIPTPTPSATPEASPPPTPTATPEPEKSPERTEPEAVKETATPAPVKKRRRTARDKPAQPALEPAVAATPLSRQDARAVAAKLKEMEKEWEASFNDPAVIEKSLAADFVATSPAGEVMTKRDLLREAKKDPSPPPKTEAHDLDVHFHGPSLAIVTGAARQFNRNRAGQLVQHNYRFTDTWVERNGTWQCVASQSMLVPGE